VFYNYINNAGFFLTALGMTKLAKLC